MKAAGAINEQFLRALALWSLLFWAGIYVLLTARSLVMRPDLPILALAGTRVLMIPVGLVLCALLFVVLERVWNLRGRRMAVALGATLAVASLLYFTVNYYVFHQFPDQGATAPNPVMKILSYLIELFWIFPAWVLLYLFLRWRLGRTKTASASRVTEGIWVKVRGSRILIGADSIRWVEAERDYARIHTDQGSHLVRSTMGALERRLSPFHFLRIHRGIIAPAPAIRSLNSSRDGRATVTLDDGTTLPAGRAYLPVLKTVLAGLPQQTADQP